MPRARPSHGAQSASPLRLLAGYGTVACALPYLALKVVWLAGGTLGVADAATMREASMVALNAVTLGMDLVAIAIALAFTHAWGQRIPAWLVLPPMWVASGLLARFALAVPILVARELLTSGSLPRVAGGPVQPWVYLVVYTGFVGIGIGLLLAFVLYARTRWGFVFQSTPRDSLPGATHPVQLPLANAAVVLAAVPGAFSLAWTLGATVGLAPELAAQRTFSSYLIHGIDTALTLAAAAGILILVRRRHLGPLWRPVALAWIGAGSLFGWGLWHLVNSLGSTALVRDLGEGMALINLLGLLQLLAGLTIGLVLLFRLAEEAAPYPAV